MSVLLSVGIVFLVRVAHLYRETSDDRTDRCVLPGSNEIFTPEGQDEQCDGGTQVCDESCVNEQMSIGKNTLPGRKR